jgi:phosphatidylinositol-3-phosphatase
MVRIRSRRSVLGGSAMAVAAALAACTGPPALTSSPGASPVTSSAGSTPAGSATAGPAGSAASRAAGPAVGYQHPCVGAPVPARYDHVIWIVMENKPAGAATGSAASPRLTSAAARCGQVSDYRAISHPSLPNYLAMTSGSTHGVTDDAGPSAHPIAGSSIFSEVAGAGGSWATFAESMPGDCVRYAASPYAVKHNPAVYYTALGGVCSSRDVPLGTTVSGPLASALGSGHLPTFSFVVPNLCNDTHDCPVSTGDQWLAQWLAAITSSAVYAAGRTAVFVTWDEDDSGHGNAVDLVVLAPSVRPGTRAPGTFTHLSLLRTTELMLGVGATLVPAAASMRGVLHL